MREEVEKYEEGMLIKKFGNENPKNTEIVHDDQNKGSVS